MAYKQQKFNCTILEAGTLGQDANMATDCGGASSRPQIADFSLCVTWWEGQAALSGSYKGTDLTYEGPTLMTYLPFKVLAS